jgi:multidrug resistance efflux pump
MTHVRESVMRLNVSLKTVVRVLLTLAIFAVAILLALWLWNHWMHSPWTRDGRVRADVVNLAPDVSGLVTAVNVHDNQLVHAGDVLLTIDRARFAIAVSQAEAAVALQQAALDQRRSEAARRSRLADVVVSSESREAANFGAEAAAAQYRQAVAALDAARLNLDRAELRAPSDGYITNLASFVGDYATAGRPLMALVKQDSFYVYGYFEETKIPLLRVGQPVRVRLIGGGALLKGHVESLSRGVTDRDNATGQELLSSVNPTFNWVRLAQRVPVRIALDAVPGDLLLSAGMTCTVIVDPQAPQPAAAKPVRAG